MKTKKELRAKVIDLETEIAHIKYLLEGSRDTVKGLRKSLNLEEESHQATQQAICDLVEKAKLDIVEKSVCVPSGVSW